VASTQHLGEAGTQKRFGQPLDAAWTQSEHGRSFDDREIGQGDVLAMLTGLTATAGVLSGETLQSKLRAANTTRCGRASCVNDLAEKAASTRWPFCALLNKIAV
jgi:hypothetical protein